MLTKRYTKATREETAVGVAHNVIGKAYLGQPFSDDELLEVVKHVETTYGTFEERPDQFHAVVGAVALRAVKHADRYGSSAPTTARTAHPFARSARRCSRHCARHETWLRKRACVV